MEIAIAAITFLISILGLLKGDWEMMPKKDKNITIMIFILMLIVGYFSYKSISKEIVNTQNMKNYCGSEMLISCNFIYSTYYKYNNNKKIEGKNKAYISAAKSFQTDGEYLDQKYDYFKNCLNPIQLKGISDALILLKYRNNEIIKNDLLTRGLYSDICKIDSTFIDSIPLYKLKEE
jgi:hypothetical protein